MTKKKVNLPKKDAGRKLATRLKNSRNQDLQDFTQAIVGYYASKIPKEFYCYAFEDIFLYGQVTEKTRAIIERIIIEDLISSQK